MIVRIFYSGEKETIGRKINIIASIMIYLGPIVAIATWIILSVIYDLDVLDSRIGFWFLINGLSQIIQLI